MDARESARLITLLDKAAEGSRDGLSEILTNALYRAKQEVAEHGRIRGRRSRRQIRLNITSSEPAFQRRSVPTYDQLVHDSRRYSDSTNDLFGNF